LAAVTTDALADGQLPESLDEGLEDPGQLRSRRWLGALLIFTGVLHFVVPGRFAAIVPRVFGRPRFWVYASGVAELASGALLLDRRTARIGGAAATATIVAVYPANIQMAIDAGAPTDVKAALTWLRLPLQFPMIAWALRHARG
jgi:uncharacterized membrane protein